MSVKLLPLLTMIPLSWFFCSTTLPLDSGLEVASGDDGHSMDPALEQWFRAHADVESVLELKPHQFDLFLKNQDSVSSAFLRLRYASASGKDENLAMESARALLKKQSDDPNPVEVLHPLYSYFLGEIIESTKAPKEDVAIAYEQLDKFGDRSCPRKDYVLKEYADGAPKADDVDSLNSKLDRILIFHSPGFRKEALEAFLDGLPEEKQSSLKQRLLPAVRPFSKLLEDNVWLLSEDEASTLELDAKEPYSTLKDIEQNSLRKKCRTAKMDYLEVLKKYKAPFYFPRIEKTALKLEQCFQKKGQRSRENYWRQMIKPLEDSFGFRGGELARRKLALLQWGRDDFKNARSAFLEIVEQAAKNGDGEIESNALYTLARIEENQGNLPASLDYYRRFTEKFSDNPKYLDAEMAMVLLNSLLKDYKAALANAESVMESQQKLSLDARSTGAMSFALFWAGRLYYGLDDKKLAATMWERVASEYYSTFYGALGHFMLEKLEGKNLVLSPSRTVSFKVESWYSEFDESDRRALMRSLSLLKLGLKDEAMCEARELVIEDGQNEKLLIKTMIQYSAGEWLAAIKNYDSLPRSFRNTLSGGFERLLFPRAYDESVHDYAKRVGLDPDLIFAIIRQESVFNPRARSTAGAKGLMQLMPGTARVESKRLGTTYLGKADRTRLKRSSGNWENLFDVETNIVLGIHHVHRLLKKYNNPVLVLASYNANPRATDKWVQNLPTEDFLAFIERIPYVETRQYVKLVLRNYFYYKRWYKSPKLELPHLEYLASNIIVGSEEKGEVVKNN